jgi:CxxC-x17-CxxC domain-containing protein
MKKNSKHKSLPPAQETGQTGEDTIVGLISKVQQQLSFLEKKIDTLISQSSEKSFNAQPPKQFQHFDHSQRRSEGRHDNYRERVLHRAICAECKKECEVPFKPSGERPVYCKDCFSKRKGGSSFNERPDNRHREARHDERSYSGRPHGGGKKKFFEKKHGPAKRRKARA